MSALFQDLRCAVRMLAKKPGFTAVVVATLALGIGANTAIFSVLNAVVLQPLPFPDPDRLVMIWDSEGDHGMPQAPAAYAYSEEWRQQNKMFDGIAVINATGVTLTGVDQPERIRGARVSAEFFPLLGVRAAVGRTFLPEDDRVGAQETVLLSDGLWRRRFGASPDVIGSTLTLSGTKHIVVGVLPSDFSFPDMVAGAEVWIPARPERPVFLSSRAGHCFRTLARLKPGVTREQALANMEGVAARLAESYPELNTGWRLWMTPLHERVVGRVRPLLLMLMGAVVLVLLIACANVGSMLLARTESRGKEFAVRGALGASRLRLVRQLLTEGVVLGLLGGSFGLLLAVWGIDSLVGLIPRGLPRSNDIGLDWRVLAFAMALSLCASLIFGLFPAVFASPSNLPESLKQGRRATPAERRRLHGTIVVSEVALALVLLIGGGLLMRSLHRLNSVELGFDPDNLLTFQLSLPDTMGLSDTQQSELYGEVLERVEALPGVRSACASLFLPLTGYAWERNFRIPSRPAPTMTQEWTTHLGIVSRDYFDTLGIPLLRGRHFTEKDMRDRPGMLIINSAMAQRFWPDSDPLGQRLEFPSEDANGDPDSYEIVGVVADSRETITDPPPAYMYVPFRQHKLDWMAFALRTSGDPESLVGAVRSEVASVTRQAAPARFFTLEQYIGQSVAQRRFAAILLSLYAAVAVALAAVGIYGVLSYSVARRTHEIGVRMAVGAQRSDVLRSVLKRGLALTAIGLGIGLAASLASTRVLSHLLYDVTATDPATFVGVSVLLAAVALLACYIPARRATKVDPIVALRDE
ncbi:MAG: ABC transporter permease [Phycisphaerales bacterium]|nr:MAG: ABC transporter permease [Phycisphaerales bacterium]